MAKFKTYDYRQRVLLPVSLEDQLMSGTLEFAIHTLVEKRLDMSIFAGKYRNDETGRAAYDPKILLKVVLLAYSRGLISSGKIERACRENVVFIALACGQQPDHSTIAAFVSSMKDEILPLFRDVLLVCEEMNLLGGTIKVLGLNVRFQLISLGHWSASKWCMQPDPVILPISLIPAGAGVPRAGRRSRPRSGPRNFSL